MPPSPEFLLPPAIEYFATFTWALGGALLGARRGYAILGVCTLAMVSAAGGGLLRDALIRNGPPVLLQTSSYLWIIAAACLIVMFFGRWVQKFAYFDRLTALVDAIGLGGYAVVGVSRALAAGMSLPGVVLVGMANAVGGGILRDVLIRREPTMFYPGTIEESSALFGCLLFLFLTQALPLPLATGAWITIAAVFLLRILAIRYRLEVRPVKGFEHFRRPPGPSGEEIDPASSG